MNRPRGLARRLLAAMLDEDGGLGVVGLEKLGVSLNDLRGELRN